MHSTSAEKPRNDGCLSFTLTPLLRRGFFLNLRTCGILILSNSKFTTRARYSSWFFWIFCFPLFCFSLGMVYVSFVYVYSAGRWCSETVGCRRLLRFRRELPLMFNSCHVTRLRRTLRASSTSTSSSFAHRGRCHELYKHVPVTRGKTTGLLQLEVWSKEGRRKQHLSETATIVSGLTDLGRWTTATTVNIQGQFSPAQLSEPHRDD